MKKFYRVICKVFHFPPHSTASQGLHPSQPKTHSVSRRRPYSSLWPLAPWQQALTVSFPFSLGRLSPLDFPFLRRRSIVCFVFCCDRGSCCLRYCAVQPALDLPTLCLNLPTRGTILNFSTLKRRRKKRGLLNHICLKFPLMGAGNPVG